MTLAKGERFDDYVYHWGWNLQDVDPNEDVKVQTLIS